MVLVELVRAAKLNSADKQRDRHESGREAAGVLRAPWRTHAPLHELNMPLLQMASWKPTPTVHLARQWRPCVVFWQRSVGSTVLRGNLERLPCPQPGGYRLAAKVKKGSSGGGPTPGAAPLSQRASALL